MEELLTQYSIDSIIVIAIFIGMLFDMCIIFLNSLSDYLIEKAWRCKDYEKVITHYIDLEKVIMVEHQEIVTTARNSYFKYLKKKERLKNLFKKKKN